MRIFATALLIRGDLSFVTTRVILVDRQALKWVTRRMIFRDLEADALGLLDALAIKRAHVVGLSQGAAITQLLAIDHPDRINTITLISGTPGGPGHEATDLPSMTPEIARVFSGEGPVEPDWNDVDSVAEYLVEGERPFAGTGNFDEDFFRATSKKVAARTTNIAAQLTNPFLISAGTPWRDKLSSISAPALVIHGETDPLFPLAHGKALAKEITGAKFLEVKGMGHAQISPKVWSQIIEAILTL